MDSPVSEAKKPSQLRPREELGWRFIEVGERRIKAREKAVTLKILTSQSSSFWHVD